MRRSASDVERVPLLGGTRLSGRTPLVAVVAFLVPSAMWLGSLAGSYTVEDFVCTAAASADRPASTGLIRLVLVLTNLVLAVLTLLAGVVGWGLLRRARRHDTDGVYAFLGTSILAFAVLYSFSIVLIGAHPLFLEVCG